MLKECFKRETRGDGRMPVDDSIKSFFKSINCLCAKSKSEEKEKRKIG